MPVSNLAIEKIDTSRASCIDGTCEKEGISGHIQRNILLVP